MEESNAAEIEEISSEKEESSPTAISDEDQKMNFIILKTDSAGSLATIKDTVDDIPNLMVVIDIAVVECLPTFLCIRPLASELAISPHKTLM